MQKSKIPADIICGKSLTVSIRVTVRPVSPRNKIKVKLGLVLC